MKIVAIDPGTTESAFVEFSDDILYTEHKNGGYTMSFPGWSIRDKGIVDNEDFLYYIKKMNGVDHFVIENIQGGKGRTIGKTTLDTVRWIGKFELTIKERFPNKDSNLVYRHKVVSHVLKGLEKPYPFSSPDSNIRHVLINRFGDKTKGVKSDEWQALALAVYFVEVELGVEL